MSRKPTEADILMLDQLKEIDTVPCKIATEWRFTEERKWKIDFVILPTSWGRDFQKIAIEIEGGAFTRGRHTRGVGFINDLEKYNHATLLGWRILRFVPSQVLDGSAIAFIKRVLG